MKKIFILLLVGVCLVGCGKKNTDEEYTGYINGSKSEAFIRTINIYINMARNEVNSGELPIYTPNTLYLIPAGDNKKLSCIPSESATSVKWNYLYIGVEYEEYSYKYFAIGEEGSYGIAFLEQSDLSTDKIYNSSRITKDGYDILYKLYNEAGSNTVYEPIDQTPEYSKLSKILPITKNGYKKVVIVGSKDCKI